MTCCRKTEGFNLIFLLSQQKVSTGFPWSIADQSGENSKTLLTEKDKIKKSESKTSPSHQDNNYSSPPNSASNLDTMPVSGVQGQNPTQGKYDRNNIFTINEIELIE